MFTRASSFPHTLMIVASKYFRTKTLPILGGNKPEETSTKFLASTDF
jgi:hypothetical protein